MIAINVGRYVRSSNARGRVTAGELRSLAGTRKETNSSVSIKTTFYVVPKAAGGAKAPLAPPAAFARYVVADDVVMEAMNDESLEMDLSDYWLVDESCPRDVLGFGVSRIELSLANSTRYKFEGDGGSAPQAPRGQAPNPGLKAPRGGPAANPPRAPALQAHAPAVPAESKVIVDLMRKAKACADKGQFWSPDPNDSETVEFWARMVVNALEEMKQKHSSSGATGAFWDSAGPYREVFKQFPVFLSQLLQDKATVASLGRFTGFFEQLKKLDAEVPPTVDLYLRMVAHKTAEGKQLNLDGLSLADRAAFCQSNLYRDFLKVYSAP